MAQFDVHRNLGRHQNSIPFVVVIQSSLFDGYRRRVVVPLVRKGGIGPPPNERLNPSFRVKNAIVVLHPLEMVSIATDQLGERVGSLASDGDAIIGALDELLARAFG